MNRMLMWLKNLAIAAMAVFAPIKTFLLLVIFLIVGDFILGILCAKKKGEKISSKRMKQKLGIDLPVYLFAIMAGFLFEVNVMPDIPLAKLIATGVAIPEMRSILENVEILTGAPIFEGIKKILSSKSSK